MKTELIMIEKIRESDRTERQRIPEIDTPLDQLRDIRLGVLVPITSWEASTSLLAGAAVKTKLEPHVVNLVGDGLNAVGPFAGVGHELPASITGTGCPAVVDVDIYYAVSTYSCHNVHR